MGAALRVAKQIVNSTMTDVSVTVSRVISTGADYRYIAVKIEYRTPGTESGLEKSEIGVSVTVSEASVVTGVSPDYRLRTDS